MELGPIREYEVDGEIVELYSYSLVSEPSGLALYVIVRDVDEFKAEFEDDVLQTLDDIGFNRRLNSPIETYQGDDCAYPDL